MNSAWWALESSGAAAPTLLMTTDFLTHTLVDFSYLNKVDKQT